MTARTPFVGRWDRMRPGTTIWLISIGLAACGGSGTPAPTSTAPANGPQAVTFVITSAGVTPRSATVSPGAQVTFVNQDRVDHLMFSDPHPEHTDCPELNQVGFLSSGQSRDSGNLNIARTCGFHDHDMPSNASLHGTITIR
jgi:plastocyanin